MEIEIYSAFVKAGVSASDAKAAVQSINKEIDKRYALHAHQLATRGDVDGVRKALADAKAAIIKWTVTTMFASVALFATITKLWH